MAQSSGAFPWVNEPLDEEASYRDGDILVIDSDVDDSPSTKADRKRRREAIGQRYLLGYVPFIQSASLKGPFSLNSGWVNPWKRARPRHLDHAHSAVPGVENTIIDLVEADNQITEEPYRYDADVEDEVAEAFYEEDFHSARNANEMDLSDLKSTPPSFNRNSLRIDNYDKDPVMVQPNSITRCQMEEDQSGRAQIEENDENRNADTGWLKGRNIAKRSHHVFMEHSSPTPAGGFRQAADKRARFRTFSIANAVGGLQRYDTFQDVNSAKIYRARTDHKTEVDAYEKYSVTDESSVFENNSRGQNIHDLAIEMRSSTGEDTEQKWENRMNDIPPETEQKFERSSSDNNTEDPLEGECLTVSTSQMSSDGESIEFIYGESFDDFNPDDIYGLYQASRLATTGTTLDLVAEPSRETKLDVVALSSSEIGPEDVRSIREARGLSRGGTLFSTGLANHRTPQQSLEPLSIELGTRGESSVGLEDMSSLRNTHSPASEQSFQYRRTNQQSKSCRASVISSEKQTPWQGDHSEAGISSSSQKSVGRIHGKSIISSGLEGEDVTNIGGPVDRMYQKKRRKQKTFDKQICSSPGIQMEMVECSSPDPLSEGFRGSSQTRFTSSSSGQIMVDELQRNGSQRPREDLDENQTELAFSDSTMRDVCVTERSAQQSEPANIEGHFDKSLRALSPLKPKLRKSGTGLESPSIDRKPLWKTLKSERLPGNSQASLHVNSQDEIAATTRWHDSALSNLGTKATNRAHALKHTPKLMGSKAPVALSNSKQSLWMTVEIEAVGRTHLTTSAPEKILHDKSEDQASLQERDLRTSDDSQITSFNSRRQSTVDKADMEQTDSPERPTSRRDSSEAILPLTSFPSTQVLVEATTGNPWNSAIKRSSLASIKKNVSFSSLPDSVYAGTWSENRTHLRSPPPESVHSIDSDDSFDYRLMGTNDIEGDGKSTTKPVNIQPVTLPAPKRRAKVPPPNPAVSAMAEAFVAADKQILPKIAGDDDKVASPQLSSMNYQDVENSGYSRKSGPGRPPARSSSPLDESFTIAPNGKLTAVNVDVSGDDADTNLANVIEEMGSIFEGWDVDAELKKVKGKGPEKSSDNKGRRQRGYLSGVSNR